MLANMSYHDNALQAPVMLLLRQQKSSSMETRAAIVNRHLEQST